MIISDPTPSFTQDDWQEASWSGARQRAALKGFDRLKAILWRRSLALYEGCLLGKKRWYRRLTWTSWQHLAALDLFNAQRVIQAADVFGETPIITTTHLLKLIESHLKHPAPSPFVDLGCGRGLCCLTAASLGIPAIGYEKEASWVQAASKVSTHLKLDCRFYDDNFLDANWPSSGTFFVVATAFSQDMRDNLAQRLATLSDTSIIITADWLLPKAYFTPIWQGLLPVNWGTAKFAAWRPPTVKTSKSPASASR